MRRVNERIAEIYTAGWSRIVAAMIRFTGGDWDLAEEATQDAFALAVQKWPLTGVPDQPLAWLTTVARNRATDRLRRAARASAKLQEVAAMDTDLPGYASDNLIPDERLELMFTCCQPSLNLDAQVALTLRRGGRRRTTRRLLSAARSHAGRTSFPPAAASGELNRKAVSYRASQAQVGGLTQTFRGKSVSD
jgi:predicted RNA polymerase sigma factor